MAQEIHFHCLLAAASQKVLRENPRRDGLIMQNNGLNAAYIVFGRPALADNTSFKLDPGATWVLDYFVPCGEMHLIGTAGDVVSILESNYYDRS